MSYASRIFSMFNLLFWDRMSLHCLGNPWTHSNSSWPYSQSHCFCLLRSWDFWPTLGPVKFVSSEPGAHCQKVGWIDWERHQSLPVTPEDILLPAMTTWTIWGCSTQSNGECVTLISLQSRPLLTLSILIPLTMWHGTGCRSRQHALYLKENLSVSILSSVVLGFEPRASHLPARPILI